MRTSDNVRLRAAVWRATDPIGHVLLLTGRTEFIEKAAIPAAVLVARGLTVVSLDWRGQGLSDRLGPDPLMGHVEDFSEFQKDLDTLLAEPMMDELTGPRIILGHSMGGCITLGALARPEIAETVNLTVLSAPMIGIAMSAPVRAIAWLTTRIAKLLGRLNRWPPFGDMKTPYTLTDPDPNVLTSDDETWNWLRDTARDYPALSIAMPTLSWFVASDVATKAARTVRPTMPVLTVLGTDEQVVDSKVVRSWASASGAAIAEMPDGRHELMIERAEIRHETWEAIDRFLTANGVNLRSVD